jgi:hypothetical protein
VKQNVEQESEWIFSLDTGLEEGKERMEKTDVIERRGGKVKEKMPHGRKSNTQHTDSHRTVE